MRRVLFVTVGTSAVVNDEIGKGTSDVRLPDGEQRKQRIQATKDQLIQDAGPHLTEDWEQLQTEAEAQLSDLESDLGRAHAWYWEHNDSYRENVKHFRQTSAESISTYTGMLCSLLQGGRLRNDHDKVVLLVSRTGIGRMAGRLNAGIFRNHMFERRPAGPGDVVLETIDDLGLHGLRQADDHSCDLYPQVNRVVGRYTTDPKAELIFNITGSYKGLIPAVTYICHAYRDRSRMIYMHENMTTAVSLTFPEGGGLKEERRAAKDGGFYL